MEKKDLYERLIPKERKLDEIASDALQNPQIITYLLEGVKEKSARIKFGCFNTLVLISELNPKALYQHFAVFVAYLSSDNKVIKLGGIKIIANLSKVDVRNQFDRIFDCYYSFMGDPEMTTAAEVSKGSPTIATAKPYLTGKITDQLLTVADAGYKTEECRNILMGHVIASFDKMYDQLENKKPVLNFVEKNANNPWSGTKKKAVKFLKKHGKMPVS